MFLSGYAIGPAEVRRLAEPVDGPSAGRAAAIARAAGIALLYGYPELGADSRIYNAALMLDRHGRRSPTTARPISSATLTAVPSQPATARRRWLSSTAPGSAS